MVSMNGTRKSFKISVKKLSACRLKSKSWMCRFSICVSFGVSNLARPPSRAVFCFYWHEELFLGQKFRKVRVRWWRSCVQGLNNQLQDWGSSGWEARIWCIPFFSQERTGNRTGWMKTWISLIDCNSVQANTTKDEILLEFAQSENTVGRKNECILVGYL